MTLITRSIRPTAPPPPQERLDIRFPQRDLKGVPQDDEWCEVVEGDGHVTRVRFHDYAQVYGIPGLYNQLFGGPGSETRCVSPQVMAGLLRDQLPVVLHRDEGGSRERHEGGSRPRLRVLDLGAGNGMMGEEVRAVVEDYEEGLLVGSTSIVGLDILQEAKAAAESERPGVYDAYVAADVTEYVKAPPGDPVEAMLFARGYNVLTSVSSLAFGDGSVRAFKAVVSLVEEGGLLVFNLKESFFDPVDSESGGEGAGVSGNEFSGLIKDAVDKEVLSIVARRRYCHRYSVTGEPLYYVAVVAVKNATLR
ncbi:hypothetical protein Daus18300_010818 [Diaporthe australafricana]|uniref:Methyltransferase type 11 domain-containing protein n=1 Tax=Diaporthe australafricana TaxID=127596 RepID=A0ABR3W915_9PEZI